MSRPMYTWLLNTSPARRAAKFFFLTMMASGCVSQGINQNVQVEPTGDVIKQLIDGGLIQAPVALQSPKPSSLSPQPSPHVGSKGSTDTKNPILVTATSSPANLVPSPNVEPTNSYVAPTLRSIKLPAGTGFVTDIAYKGSNTIAVSTETGQVLFSTNGGSNWARRDFSGQPVQSIAFRGDVLIGARQKALFAYDATQSAWKTLSSTIPSGVGKIAFFDDQHGLVSLDTGAVLQTSDGGVTWEDIGNAGTRSRTTYNDQIAIGDVSKRTALILLNGALQRYENGLLSTTSVVPGTASILFADQQNAWVSGTGGLYLTRDGGSKFNKVSNLIIGDRSADVSSGVPIAFANNALGLIVYGETIYFTPDSGASWIKTELKTPLESRLTSLYAAVQDGRLIGYAYDSAQQILHQISIPLPGSAL